jgi:hypothetical protein
MFSDITNHYAVSDRILSHSSIMHKYTIVSVQYLLNENNTLCHDLSIPLSTKYQDKEYARWGGGIRWLMYNWKFVNCVRFKFVLVRKQCTIWPTYFPLNLRIVKKISTNLLSPTHTKLKIASSVSFSLSLSLTHTHTQSCACMHTHNNHFI